MAASFANMTTLRLVLLTAPALYILATCATLLSTPERAFRLARAAAALACVCALVALLGVSQTGAIVVPGAAVLSLKTVGALTLSLRADMLGMLMLLLVSFLGWVIIGYSQRYLSGDPGRGRFLRWLLVTLASVCLLVLTNNLAVLALTWIATSLSLHQLLSYYRERPQAQLAARKKFLASRIGDLCLFGALVLIGRVLHTLEIDAVLALLGRQSELPIELHLSAGLLAASALVKCAQFPLHGWLMQVMEAPTPVSALLHAGVVNLGGFVLLRLAPLVGAAGGAQVLLGIVGSSTAVLAALVMMTRVSVKEMLAWSTCAQMGFMLTQIALGAYDLALLHLLAHSLYKAHAFLSAGSRVDRARLQQLLQARAQLGLRASFTAGAAGLGAVMVSAWLWQIDFSRSPSLVVLGFVLSLALAPLLAERALRIGGLWPLALTASALGVACAYFGIHRALSACAGLPRASERASALLLVWVGLCFAALYLMQTEIRLRPQGRLARTLYPWFSAGLHLDAWLTRLSVRSLATRLTALSDPAPSGSSAPASAAAVPGGGVQ